MFRPSNSETQRSPPPWYHRIGPGLITACVVIGPGSILTSSKVGAQHGYAMNWVVVVAVFFMMVYTTLAAKLGVVADRSPGDLISHRLGRWLSVLIGTGVFFISAAFQFGNNLGVHAATSVYFQFDYTIVVFNALTIGFLFLFKDLYRAVERLMMALVGLMLISFALNLALAQPSLSKLVQGFIPRSADTLDLSLLGLVGTTFVITAAYYQAYLVRQKGWGGETELSSGLLTARIGSLIMALITLMIVSTSAAVLQGQQLNSVSEVASQLKPLFGMWGQTLFCLGLFSAAYSSFLVNSMIGGFILADSLGLDSEPKDLAPRLLTTTVLLTGMGVALYAIRSDHSPVAAIVAAQAVTVVAAPLMAGALLWLTNRKDVMGENCNTFWTNIWAGLGLLLLLAMAYYTAAEKVWPAVREALG
jgi:manganese transport protein